MFKMLGLNEFTDQRGWLGVIQKDQIPFKIERVFFIRDVPEDSIRGGHAHLQCHELIICLNGKVEAYVDDGFRKEKFELEVPYQALYLSPMTWVTLKNFKKGTVLAVVASHLFDPHEKLLSYKEFKTRLLGANQNEARFS